LGSAAAICARAAATEIQKRIDDCAARGGGTVSLPAGRYVTGTILLRDNVTLNLEEGAQLLGSTDIADYQNIDSFTDGTGSAMGYCLIGAVDAKNVAITGAGAIDGQGKELLARINKDRGKRPFLVRFVRCIGVAMRGVRLESPAAWTTHFFQCRDVTAERVTIDSHAGSNNDGFDIDSCEHVRIRDCSIDTGDDAICLKTTSHAPCRDIRVTGCTLKTNCAGFKIGTESAGDFEDIHVSDCRIVHAGLGGIKLLSVDGARLRNVEVSGVTIESGHVAVFLRLGSRLKTFRAGDAKRETGTLSGIRIRDLRGTVESTGIMICGVPGHPVEDVTMERVDLRLTGVGTKEDAAAAVPEQEAAYPEIRMFGPKLPAYGLYVRHARKLDLRGVTLKTAEVDARPAVASVDVQDAQLPQ
jgi:polygalacturonase